MKVSIGIPVYGVEKYIERCAKSLLDQTYQDIEYIFVDDCSPDNSIDILYKVLSQYPTRKEQVKVIRHDKNLGSACTRNTAVRHFTGDFVMWVDSDDWIEKNTVSTLVDIQSSNNCDLITFDSVWHYPHKQYVFHNKNVDTPLQLLYSIFDRTNINAIWGRFIRRSLYVDYGVSCKAGVNMGEDLQVITKLLYFAKSICVCNKSLYHYECSNMGSYMASYSTKKTMQAVESLHIVCDFFKDKDQVLVEKVNSYVAYSYATFLAGSINGNDREIYSYILNCADQLPQGAFSKIPISYRTFFVIRNYTLMRAYAKIGKFINKIFCKK